MGKRSEVKTIQVAIGATSVTVATAITPTSGTSARIVSVRTSAQNLVTDPDEIEYYFVAGANITTTPANAITVHDTGTDGSDETSWPIGGGPIGDVDEVVAWRTLTETETGLQCVIAYTEE